MSDEIQEEMAEVPQGPGRLSNIWAWCWRNPRRRLRLVSHGEPGLYNGGGEIYAHDRAPERPASNPMPVETLYKDSIPKKGRTQ